MYVKVIDSGIQKEHARLFDAVGIEVFRDHNAEYISVLTAAGESVIFKDDGGFIHEFIEHLAGALKSIHHPDEIIIDFDKYAAEIYADHNVTQIA